MIISTRGRYALQFLVDLAEHQDEGHVSVKEIAARQEVSPKYLERILPVLVKNGIIDGVQGKGGGYRLCRKPEEYTLGEILRLTEGSLAPVSCLEDCTSACGKASGCRTQPVWNQLDRIINEYLDSVTVADLLLSGEKPI